MKKGRKIISAVLTFSLLMAVGFSTPAAASTSTAHRYKVYLSPSAQIYNPYCDGSGSEEFWMRKVAEAMGPYLNGYGIDYVIADPQTGEKGNQRGIIDQRVKQAQDTKCDLYLSIHSNATNGNGTTQGTMVFYYSTSAEDKRLAESVAAFFPYPDRDKISLRNNDSLWEMYLPTMPHVLVETAFHDNAYDTEWIQSNIEGIAASLSVAISVYADIPYAVNLSSGQETVSTGMDLALSAYANTYGNGANTNKIAWSSGDNNVATVDQNGMVHGVAPGTAIVTAAAGGVFSLCTVTVE